HTDKTENPSQSIPDFMPSYESPYFLSPLGFTMAPMARQKKDPAQYSLFDALIVQEGTTHVSAGYAGTSTTRSRRDANASTDREPLQSSPGRMGGLSRPGRTTPDQEVPAAHRPASSRVDGQANASQSDAADSGRANLRGLHSTANRQNQRDDAGLGRGRDNRPGRTDLTDPVANTLGLSANEPEYSAAGLRNVAREDQSMASDSNRLPDGDGLPGRGISERTRQQPDSTIREGNRPSSSTTEQQRSIDTNIAAVRIAVDIRDNQRSATEDELRVLRNYRSWGSFPQLFNDNDPAYALQRAELQTLLTDEEYQSARSTITTAFYTPPEISQALWNGLETAGFSQGRVLEPGVGTGGFVASAPDGAHMVGVERDAMSALIANALYPDAQIRREDFADTQAEDNSFDVAIGNVPFSQTVPYDPARNRAGLSTHNYFISKSIDLTAPGGYVAVISSQHSADSAGRGTSVQQLLTDRADFITGVRLPGGRHGAFSDYAGTEA